MLPPVIDVEYYGDKKNNPPGLLEVQEQLKIMLDKVEERALSCDSCDLYNGRSMGYIY